MSKGSEYQFEAAGFQVDVYPPEHLDRVRVTNPETGAERDMPVKGCDADMALMDVLITSGVPILYAFTFVQILWLAGHDLGGPVSVAHLAERRGRCRMTVNAHVKRLQEYGIIEREYPRSHTYTWRFRRYEDLVSHLEMNKWKG